jgi:Uma2 family endonuclease
MSAVPRQPDPPAYSGARMTAEQFLGMGQTDARMQLVHGVVVLSPSPQPIHQRILDQIQGQLFMLRQHGLAVHVFPDTDIVFDARLVYRPDLAIYRAERLPAIPDRLTTTPDLIIEILSPSNKPMDLITKREDYEHYGVPEYIVIDPHTGRSTQWARRGEIYHEIPPAGDTLTSDAIPGLRIDLRPIRASAQP